ncbi:DUF3179 domain-containing (seleno)protein [Pseudomonas aeruginosa]
MRCTAGKLVTVQPWRREPVSITYCPLTATAIGFKRGNTSLGVSGKLLNSNVVCTTGPATVTGRRSPLWLLGATQGSEPG